MTDELNGNKPRKHTVLGTIRFFGILGTAIVITYIVTVFGK